ncbi:MAG: saccharopine dehydrogenase NADP-binding domain-containing protein [Burkholderiales bacterium]|nr:saccharopine dehydrogenase NADP-binding domain-containing protein [Burkholderiales bacterium]
MAARRNPRDRSFDVVLYGATGFVGRQTVAYFARHAKGLRWALAGRSHDKLAALREASGAKGAGLVVADAADAEALDALAADARVVLSSAGPFARYGSALVAACARHGTHYCDITGETPWVRDMIDRHHAEAARNGARIVPCCGFDSVPSDLGAWLAASTLAREHGEACVSVKACFSLRGGLNGGTLASLINILDSGERKRLADPFLLNPAPPKGIDPRRHADPVAPHRDADFKAWVGPFFMGPINTRVARRSAALLSGRGKERIYAPDYHYQEYLRFGGGVAAGLIAAGMSVGMAVGQGALRFKPARWVAEALGPPPGQGPSERTMDRGSFRCELVGVGEKGAVVRGRIAGRGDPGNRATTIFVCESALALARDADTLPGGAGYGGVLTPASALGDVLARRLAAAGMTIEPLA